MKSRYIIVGGLILFTVIIAFLKAVTAGQAGWLVAELLLGTGLAEWKMGLRKKEAKVELIANIEIAFAVLPLVLGWAWAWMSDLDFWPGVGWAIGGAVPAWLATFVVLFPKAPQTPAWVKTTPMSENLLLGKDWAEQLRAMGLELSRQTEYGDARVDALPQTMGVLANIAEERFGHRLVTLREITATAAEAAIAHNLPLEEAVAIIIKKGVAE